MIASCSEGEEESHRRVWTNSPAIIRKSATQRAQGRQAVLLRQGEAFEPVHQVAGRGRRIDDCFWSAGEQAILSVGHRRVWTNSPGIIGKSATQRAQGRQAVLLRPAEAFEPRQRVSGRNRRRKYASVAFGGGRVSWAMMTSFP